MADDVKSLLLQVDAQVELLRRNLAKGDERVADFERSVNRRMDNVDKSFLKAGTGISGIGRHIAAVQSRMNGFSGTLRNIAAAVGVAFSVDAITGAISRALDYASSLGEVSQQLGVTTKDLQFYRYVATQTGITQDEMDQGLAKLTKTLGQAADGGKKQAQAFKDLGVNIRDANGDLRDAGGVLPDIADGISKLKGVTLQGAAATDLFGKAGQKLLPALQGGSAGINGLAAAYRRLGIELTPEQIQNADDAADKLAAVKKVLEARIAGVVADNADEIVRLADSLANLADKAVKAAGAWAKWVARSREAPGSYTKTLIGPDTGGLFDIVRRGPTGSAQVNKVEAPPPLLRRGAPQPSPFMKPQTSGVPLRGGGGVLGAAGLLALANIDFGAVLAGTLASSKASVAKTNEKVTAFTIALDGLEADLAIALADLSGSYAERAAAEKQQIEVSRKEANARVQADDQLTKTQKAQIVAVNDKTAAARTALVDQRDADRIARDRVDIEVSALQDQQDLLRAQSDLARTAEDRRTIELQLLDLQFQEEKIRLEGIVASREASDAEKKIAQARLAMLGQLQSAEAARIDRDNEGPGASYLRDLRKTPAELQEDFERLRVDGLERLNDELADSAASLLKIGGVGGRVINGLIADLARLAIQQALIRPLAEGLFGGGGGGGILSGILSGIGSIFSKTPGGGLGGGYGTIDYDPMMSFGGFRANGGDVQPGKWYMVGERGPEPFVPKISGTVLSNSSLGGGGGPNISLTVNAPGATAETVAMIRREIRNAAPQIVAASRNATLRDASRTKL